jgi:hypothetical protein
VFADLEFNLYVPRREFMPHFERICNDLGKLDHSSHQTLLYKENFAQLKNLFRTKKHRSLSW